MDRTESMPEPRNTTLEEMMACVARFAELRGSEVFMPFIGAWAITFMTAEGQREIDEHAARTGLSRDAAGNLRIG